MTVVETVQFLRDADSLMTDPDRARLVEFLGTNPEAGDLMPETGGVRKLRWALPGRGKRGGARVIYFFMTSGCRCSCSRCMERARRRT